MPPRAGYLMENSEEAIRLEVKTDQGRVQEEARWCGLGPGQSVLDAGCGPGKTSLILHGMVQPGGAVLGVDYSPERIAYADRHYRCEPNLQFELHDLRDLSDRYSGRFDLVWARFVLEYNRVEGREIVRNLKECLKPGGTLCLIDLDHNCLGHFELPPGMAEVMAAVMRRVDEDFNFDTYAGRRLYAYLYDAGLEDIGVDVRAHHLIYGKVRDEELFNWTKKMEVAALRLPEMFKGYPGGAAAFERDFRTFFQDPRRFTYTPVVMVKGRKK